ncbi:MAG: hypothetical protein A2845_00330 [Candidatus Lloydbacteria bacterium RIFCSPHIGHO2_01_FULL_49_22]|uniref:Phosphomannomutase/phosphoglucomutase n=1 Tax=Candidatus Lloydbacteria bacterium RIFCSPHIGHO2_01_FULL_49_22 TaxID=1798658 RepID=A0A1G2CZZ6_9BACT|nr:MAG: hypothetical protein A2845_00330 [Candidatus Lloydbacteria bacterium RIFCSPHIGHO2_01_FULL_49_22]OGZ09311.1 MAG: hypothetical protein A3C14_05235 [Candidatus Lloydbacteria bacterium RIFCSPHIGHO2_02_FULL_50_18]
MTNIFKSYDIRGVYPSELNEEIIEKIGHATVIKLRAKSLAVGRDNRDSSPSLFDAFTRGAMDEGCTIIDLGLVSTPMLYFASATLSVDGAVMITASHNPGQYNGLKICQENAIPLGLNSGLSDIRDIMMKSNFKKDGERGNMTTRSITADYHSFLLSFADLHDMNFRLAFDPAHAMGVLELPIFHQIKNIEIVGSLYDTLEAPGTCPHEANPLNTETLEELSLLVKEKKADMGVAFDGDADRVGFVDELGNPVPMDLITAIIAPEVLRRHPGATILYDLRSSRTVKEEIEAAGGIAKECMVGHANIKKHMRETGAVFAGELSGHYYFTENGYAAEMGALPAILIMNIMASSGKKLSELVQHVSRYAHSGELNFAIKNSAALFTITKEKYADGKLDTLDGIKISYPNWWFSLRASNTEPLVRLNIEGDTSMILEDKKLELLSLINLVK